MRALLPMLCVGWSLGIVLADRGALAVGGGLGIGAAGLALGIGSRRRRVLVAASLLLVVGGGSVALARRTAEAARARPVAPREATVEARVERAWRSANGPRLALGRVRGLGPEAAALPPRLMLRLEPEVAAPLPGARIRARLRIGPAYALRNPGRPRDPRRLERAGIGARARLVHPAWLARIGDAGGPAARLASLRRRLGARLERSGEGGALLRALALGDPSGLALRDRDAFRALGVAHLLAVSGLHLALVAGGALWLARRGLARSSWLASRVDTADPARALALLAAAGYAGLCGFGVPVRRALVLVAALVAAALRARRTARFHPIWIAALLVLFVEPDALFHGGARLSFAAAAALVWDASRGAAPRSRVGRAARASSVAIAATAPLAAWHWGSAAPFAALVNLLAIPWTGFVLLPAALLAAGLAAAGVGPEGPVPGALARLAAVTLAAGRWAADRMEDVPAVALDPLALCAALGVAAGVLVVRRPLPSLLLAGLLGGVLRVAPPAPVAPPPPRVVALDVGRGDAVLVQGREGALLVDAGAALPDRFDLGRSAVVPALRALGVRRLDRIVASHADLDHRGGLPAVIRAVPAGALWLPPGGLDEAGFATLRAAAGAVGLPVREVGQGTGPVRLGDLQVTPVWPPPTRTVSRNEGSLGLRVEIGGRRVLLLGDVGSAEASLVASGRDLAADVLLLPHHGSAGSASAALLRAVAPRIALVSAPCPPQRGLPHPHALARAEAAGARLGWTGRDGAVFVALGERLAVRGFAAPRAHCAHPDPADQRSSSSTSRS